MKKQDPVFVGFLILVITSILLLITATMYNLDEISMSNASTQKGTMK